MDARQQELHSKVEDLHWWFLGKRQIIKTLLSSLVPPNTESLIVDVGCATGGNVGALAEGYEVLGIDLSTAAIDLARQRFPELRFWQGELRDAPENLDEGASCYLLTDVLEHVPDDYLFLSTLLARCQQGAYVLLTVPADDALWSSHDVALGHYRRYDRSQLERVWQGLPVTPLLVSYFNSRLYPPIRIVRWLTRHAGISFGQRGTDIRVPPEPLNRLLAALLGGESKVLKDCLLGRRSEGYTNGVSLVAILRVDDPRITPRERPDHVNFDHQQAAGTPS